MKLNENESEAHKKARAVLDAIKLCSNYMEHIKLMDRQRANDIAEQERYAEEHIRYYI